MARPGNKFGRCAQDGGGVDQLPAPFRRRCYPFITAVSVEISRLVRD